MLYDLQKLIHEKYYHHNFYPVLSQCLFSGYDIVCGTDRWKVKTLTDSQADEVDLNDPVLSSVHEQTVFSGHNVGKTTPRLDDEKTVYKIRCWLLGFKTEDDRDYHLIIKDERRKDTMIAEKCDPDCPGVRRSPAYSKFIRVRNKFTTYFNGRQSRSRIHYIYRSKV